MNLLDTHKFKKIYNNILKRFINIIKIRFGYTVKFIKINNKQFFKGKYQNFFIITRITLK